MGLGCSKRQSEDSGGDRGPTIVRLSPFRPRRCSSLRRSRSGAPADGAADDALASPPSLLAVAADAAAASLARQPAGALAALPADLSQLLLERLVATGALDDAAVARLSGLGLHFYRLPLAAYPEAVRPAWLAALTSASLEEADLSKTGVGDGALAAMGAPPRLARLRLDYCVEVTDGGLALLQGMASLEELSLNGCEQLTPLGLRHLAGLTRLRRLSLQTCNQIGELAALGHLRLLEVVDLGWCSAVGDADASVLPSFSRLRELSLARTRITDAGLAFLHSLRGLQCLSLAGLDVSDGALAALVRHLPCLRRLNLERCSAAGDATLAALGEHAPLLEELCLGYTAASDRGLPHLSSLAQLRSLSLEACSVGDHGLQQALAGLAALRCLDISDTGATNACMPAVAGLRRLELLNLSFTLADDWGLKRLRRMASLRCLNLDSRLFTDAGLAHISRLTGLECLDLFGARITDAGCPALARLTALRRLEVCGGGLSDGGVAHLAALSRLQHLSLAQNYRVGNGSVSHLLRLGALTALNLSQTRVTSNSVVALGCLAGLQTLALHETRVKPFAVDKLLAANPDLEVQGVAPTRSSGAGAGTSANA